MTVGIIKSSWLIQTRKYGFTKVMVRVIKSQAGWNNWGNCDPDEYLEGHATTYPF